MKSYTLPAAVLVAVSGCMLLGLTSSMKHAGQAQAKLATDRQALQTAQLELTSADRAARDMAKKSRPAEQFLDIWTPRLTAETSIDEIFGRLDTLAVDNLLSPSGKNFTTSSKYFFNGRQLSVQSVDITVAGEFARTLNWLGAVEAAFPLARVQQLSYTGAGNSLALAAHLVFPRKFATP